MDCFWSTNVVALICLTHLSLSHSYSSPQLGPAETGKVCVCSKPSWRENLASRWTTRLSLQLTNHVTLICRESSSTENKPINRTLTWPLNQRRSEGGWWGFRENESRGEGKWERRRRKKDGKKEEEDEPPWVQILDSPLLSISGLYIYADLLLALPAMPFRFKVVASRFCLSGEEQLVSSSEEAQGYFLRLHSTTRTLTT